ncbi:alternate-type signal peptide domain-containing protein [Zafaria sp. J156]|uniref:alternate-type signal peptide domain-containing protein n=1 Tax=Zafaria sp. J156 TaxID=3116490 RepID=UPI002E7A4E08|nr:alternate-type signal peptide domain-containing protein [Zafaria sp. J156]MEE1621900.1 alternate-type signal peptide domain-containing protein [Zafaria sp. J156]
MNKMTKGALATGLGVALLIGGGGTLAVWNQAVEAPAGTVAAGDLELTAGQGTWTDAAGKPVSLGTYKVVPGDRLTFTQPLTVKLVGDKMRAELTTTDLASGSPLIVGATTLAKDNTPAKTELLPADSGDYTASVTVELPAATSGRVGTNLNADLGRLTFTLEQIAPTAAP